MTQEHHLSIHGHKIVALEYNEHLDSIPVIFIHGIANSVYLWEPIQIAHVTRCYRWFSLSLPGHYPACLPDHFNAKDLTPQLMSEVMSEAVYQLTKGEPALLIGYSTGGYASLCIAHHAPELIERMLILDGFAKAIWGDGLGMATVMAHLQGIGSTLVTPYLKLAKINLMATRFAYNVVGTDLKAMAEHPKFDEVVQSNWDTVQAGNPMQLYPYFRHMFHIDISDYLPEINTEILILHGSEDRLIIPQHAEHMHGLLPNSDLQWIEGSGHLPFLERPNLYEQYLTNWLQQ